MSEPVLCDARARGLDHCGCTGASRGREGKGRGRAEPLRGHAGGERPPSRMSVAGAELHVSPQPPGRYVPPDVCCWGRPASPAHWTARGVGLLPPLPDLGAPGELSVARPLKGRLGQRVGQRVRGSGRDTEVRCLRGGGEMGGTGVDGGCGGLRKGGARLP